MGAFRCSHQLSGRPLVRNRLHVRKACRLVVRAASSTKPSVSKSVPSSDDSGADRDHNLTAGLYQQTLFKSFTFEGLGLHSAETSCVRVRPASAGEGRYFVRVPYGTNRHLAADWTTAREQVYPPVKEELDEDLEDYRAEKYVEYRRAVEDKKFAGSFGEYMLAFTDYRSKLYPEGEPKEQEPEPFPARSDDEEFLIANLDNVADIKHEHCLTLGNGDFKIQSVECLLSALEGVGIDNARIEIEGGSEIPVIDGSPHGWIYECRKAGLCQALANVDGEKRRVRRAVLKIDKVVTVGDGDRFITLYPCNDMKITYGIDHSDVAGIIGQQWLTWSALTDGNYSVELALARPYVTEPENLYLMRDKGFVKAGTEDLMLIADGDDWYNPDNSLVRYRDNEPVKRKMVDLIAALSLLSLGGTSGIPYGHIVAYKADHDLHVQFCKALKEAVGDSYYAGYEFDPSEPVPDPEQRREMNTSESLLPQ